MTGLWWVPAVVVAGWAVLVAALLAGLSVALRKPWPEPGPAVTGWTAAELAALRGETSLPAGLERYPFEDEYEAPDRARAWARREYDNLISKWEDLQ
jgi:hypothetical protein